MKLTDEFEPVAGIYIIRCLINNKYYIGETINLKKRISNHLSDTRQAIHKAMTKYGLENFEIEAYPLPNFDKPTLVDLEEELIKKFKSLRPYGYNVKPRGKDMKGFKHSPESLAKISEALQGNKNFLGKKHSQKTKTKMSEAQRGEKNHNFGKIASEETRKKLSYSRKGDKNHNFGRKLSEDHRRKISESKKGKPRKSPPSEESRKKMSEAKSLYWAKKKGLI